MIRYNLYIPKEYIDQLSELPGTVSEHIRQAISEYLEKNNAKKSVVSPTKTGRVEKASKP